MWRHPVSRKRLFEIVANNGFNVLEQKVVHMFEDFIRWVAEKKVGRIVFAYVCFSMLVLAFSTLERKRLDRLGPGR